MKNKKCSAMVFSLITLAVMIIVSVGSYEASIINQKTSTDTEKSVSSFEAADSGVEIVSSILNNKIKETGGSGAAALLISVSNVCNGSNMAEYVDTDFLNGKKVTVQLLDINKNLINCTDPNATIERVEYLKSTGEFGGTARVVEVRNYLDCSDIPDDGSKLCVYNGKKYAAAKDKNGSVWLDRNLGAEKPATDTYDPQAIGEYFQWGRARDGHEKSNSALTINLSPTTTPGHSDFILTPASPYDWTSSPDSTLWNISSSYKNNPCPDGWHVPTKAEWQAMILAESIVDYNGFFASNLKIPFTGRRSYSNGSVGSTTSFAYYWTSDVSPSQPSQAMHLSYVKNITGISFTSENRAMGMAIRCKKN